MVRRSLNIQQLLDKSSYFLLGPRGTGKSFLIREFRAKDSCCDVIDLLDSRNYLRLKTNPHDLEKMLHNPRVIIDEVQRVPELLNEVHRLIETKSLRFLLTGSSTRKLRHGGTNLLAGRALQAWMMPMSWWELEQDKLFDLEKYLRLGGLPRAYLEEIGQDYLFAYVDTYLKEEIQAEALVRNLANYSRFLQNAAICNGHVLNYAKIANDAQLSPNTVRDYYQILEDTLLGFQLAPWTKSKKRKAIQTAKFYFFDIGVVHALCNRSSVERASDTYGRAFEHFVAQELRAFLAYSQVRQPCCFWRSKHHHEVDFVVGDDLAIEVKSGEHVTERDHHGLTALGEEKTWQHRLVVSQDETAMSFPSGIRHLHWRDFLQRLWAREFI